jgi:hypothetical protein
VRVGDELYVRSWRGDDGRWYPAARAGGQGRISAGAIERDVAYDPGGEEVDDAVNGAHRRKQGRYTGYIEPMIAPQERATALRLVPCKTVPA